MSRKAMLMSLSAGVAEDDFQSVNEACTAVVDDRTSDQSLPPTAIASRPISRVNQGSSSEPTRSEKRRVFFRRYLDPNNRNRMRPDNGRDTSGMQRSAYEQRTQSNRLSENTKGNPQGRTSHAQRTLSSHYLPMPTTQIYNVHYHYQVAPYQVGLGPYAPVQFQPVVPNQSQNPRSIPHTSAWPIVAHGAHEQAVGSQGRPQPQIHAQQQALGAASAAAQQQGLNFISQPIASSDHSHFPHVGVAITPPSSANAEPRLITRTQTMPIRTAI